MHQFGATGIPASRREADTRSPLDDDDEDLINPGSPNTFEDDISEDEVSLSRSPPPPPQLPPTSQPPSSIPPPILHGPPTSLPLSLDPKLPVCSRASPLTATKDSKDQGRVSPLKDDGHECGKSGLVHETPVSIPSSLQALAPALTIASLVSSHKRPASPSDHYVTPIRPIPERHVFGYAMQPMTKRPFTLSPIRPLTDRHFLSSAGAFQPIRLQSKQKDET